MSIEEKFQQFIIAQDYLDQKICLMVSGGVDSMVLLDIAVKAVDPKNIVVFHLDHNVRDDSQYDLKFVHKTCSTLGVKFYEKTLSADHENQNVEAHWRKLRKKHVNEAATDFGAKTILTAHHATDLVETMIFRLTKGCGINGLSPFDKTTKPFWDIPKSELIKYATENQLEWKEDSSNNNTDFERNLIRQEVLPHLRKITPNLEKVFVNESKIFEETQDLLDQLVVIQENKIELKSFLKAPKAIQREFLRKISKKTPSFSEIEDGLKWLKGNPQGNSQKEIGKTKLRIVKGDIVW